MQNRPVLVYADAEGRIFDWPRLEMAGASGGSYRRVHTGEWMPMPEGSELFLLPGRLPVGYDRQRKRFEVLKGDPFAAGENVQAVAAFIAPAHTQILSAAYRTQADAPLLPLFAYTAVGWLEDRFVVAGLRVDPDERQEFRHFDADTIKRNAQARMAATPRNRLLQHLGRCALGYGCPAARNLFMNRWEAPLPTSPTCNARCLGCISLQQGTGLCATQQRIDFVPSPDEVAEIALPHLREAPQGVVSFGQGCEGEPLLEAETLASAIGLIRQGTHRGTVNLNSNASLPLAVQKLARTGLDSLRVSLNSCRAELYHAYYRPKGYRFEQVKESVRVMKAEGKFVSLNYFVLPGFTDDESEWQALRQFIRETGPDLIQWRNFNIDPEWYRASLDLRATRRALGVPRLMERLRDEFPDLRFGYFNPCLDSNIGVEPSKPANTAPVDYEKPPN